MINIENLLQEVSTDSPCGEDLEYDPIFRKLEESAQGKAEQQMGDTVIPAEEPDWSEVQKVALELSARTKDLRVVFYLTRALVNTEGLIGFKDGLALFRGLLDKYWKTIHPALDTDDDNDPTMRINTLMSLCDEETILSSIRETPLVTSKAFGRFSLKDYAAASGDSSFQADSGKPPVEKSAIEAAFMDSELENIQTTAGSIREGIDHIHAIEKTVTNQVGAANAPNFSNLTKILKEADRIVSFQLSRRGANNSTETVEDKSSKASTVAVSPATVKVSEMISSREDVVCVLDKVCDYFRKNEPSSPVPILLQRAKRLVSKDFLEILNDLVPDGVKQAEAISGTKSKK